MFENNVDVIGRLSLIPLSNAISVTALHYVACYLLNGIHQMMHLFLYRKKVDHRDFIMDLFLPLLHYFYLLQLFQEDLLFI